ncbi:MAG: LytTR family transcriptional regulator DNA-binding domain-containing protein [Lachnospiraceae bacterium]|nr:LytTR family transcriptional regulator DNA-binding domain-containing protein [Lachnospiraceae bacterium]
MKVTLQQISAGTEEVVIKYKDMTEQIEGIVNYINRQEKKLIGLKEGQQYAIPPQNVIYLESVDGVTYLYTSMEVYRTNLSLAAVEAMYMEEGYFRCSKAMIINIYRITKLKSESGNRIDAMMDNGEHVIISRRYAKELRRILRGET